MKRIIVESKKKFDGTLDFVVTESKKGKMSELDNNFLEKLKKLYVRCFKIRSRKKINRAKLKEIEFSPHFKNY